MAYLEAASVLSFRRLRLELASHGAPRRLLRAVTRAARDEVRHARTMKRWAIACGVRPEQPALESAEPRSLAEIATENAAEGCVAESYGALTLAFQARHAASAAFRATFRSVARDELRHAELAWAIAHWLEARLSQREHRRCRDAIHQGLATIASGHDHDNDGVAELGLPDAEASRRLRLGFARALAA
jgi:hypothetical protein